MNATRPTSEDVAYITAFIVSIKAVLGDSSVTHKLSSLRSVFLDVLLAEVVQDPSRLNAVRHTLASEGAKLLMLSEAETPGAFLQLLMTEADVLIEDKRGTH